MNCFAMAAMKTAMTRATTAEPVRPSSRVILSVSLRTIHVRNITMSIEGYGDLPPVRFD